MIIKMRAAWIGVFGALALFTAGCDGGPSYEIADGALSGKINSTDWTFVSGETNDFLSDEKGFFTTLYAEKIEACGFGAPTKDIVLLDVPKVVGDYDLGLTHNVTMAHDSDNKVAITGLLTVEEITDTEVKAGVYAIFNDDPDYEISGHFTATVCPPSP